MIAILGIAVLVLVAVVFFSTVLLRRVFNSWQDALHDARDVRKSAETVLAHAHEEAIEIFRKTQATIKDFEEAFEKLGMDAEKQLKEAFGRASRNEERRLSGDFEEFHVVHREMIEANKKSYQQGIQLMVQEIAKTAETAEAEFVSAFRQQISDHHAKMDSEFAELQKQQHEAADAYKKEAIKKIEESVYSFLAFVSVRVLGSALDLESHQKLVMRVLEDAKRENFFN